MVAAANPVGAGPIRQGRFCRGQRGNNRSDDLDEAFHPSANQYRAPAAAWL